MRTDPYEVGGGKSLKMPFSRTKSDKLKELGGKTTLFFKYMLIFLFIMGVEEIAETAKNGISEFCMNKCKGTCCRDTILYLESEEEL